MNAEPGFDLLLTEGEVIDVGGGHRGVLDVGITGGLIRAVGPRLPRAGARRIVDVSGRIVTPGLVDLHTHVLAGTGYWGIDPSSIAWRSGVTTWVDAGSAGAYTLSAALVAIGRYPVRVPLLLNISARGLVAPTGENRDLSDCDPQLAAATVAEHRDRVVGVKVRIDRHAVGDSGLEPLRRAVAVGVTCDVPVMVHVGEGPPDIGDVLPLLRAGDIVTHCASGVADASTVSGPATAAFARARAAGVLLDLGHGSGGFAFDVLQERLAAGLAPDTVSTDLHSRSVHGPVYDLPTTMSKLLAVGLPLADVIAAATVRPATALRLPAGTGTLAVGARADVAVFRLEEGRFEVEDCHGGVRISPVRLMNEATYVGGRRLPPGAPPEPQPWIPLSSAQRRALAKREQALRDLLGEPLVGPGGLDQTFPRRPPTGS